MIIEIYKNVYLQYMKSRLIHGGCQASAPFSPEFAIKVLTEICKEITMGDQKYSLISATQTFFFVTLATDKVNPPLILKYGVKTNTNRIFNFLELENEETKSLVTFFLIFLENCMEGGSAPTKPQPEDTPCVPGTEVTVDDIIFFVTSVLKNEIITYQESNFSLKEPLIIFSLGSWRCVLQKKDPSDDSTQHIDIKYAPIGSIKNNILTFVENYVLPFFIEERTQMIKKIKQHLPKLNSNPNFDNTVKPIINGLKLHTRLTGNNKDDIETNLVRLPREDLQKLLELTKTI